MISDLQLKSTLPGHSLKKYLLNSHKKIDLYLVNLLLLFLSERGLS